MNNDNQNLGANRDPLLGTLVGAAIGAVVGGLAGKGLAELGACQIRGARCLKSHQPV